MRALLGFVLAAGLMAPPLAAQSPTKTLQIYYVDTEGGQANAVCRALRRIAARRHR